MKCNDNSIDAIVTAIIIYCAIFAHVRYFNTTLQVLLSITITFCNFNKVCHFNTTILTVLWKPTIP